MEYSWYKRLLSELLATYTLVLVGTGSIVFADVYVGSMTHVGVSAAFGLIVFLMIIFFARYSGAHMNPAVTLSLALYRKFPSQQTLPYVFAQLTGALLASGTLKLFFPQHDGLGVTLPQADWRLVFLLEFFMSFVLMLVILWVSNSKRMNTVSAGFFIGLTVFLEAFFGGPFTGASMNPARSIGPAIISGKTESLWMYLLAPILGMMLSGYFYLRKLSRNETLFSSKEASSN